MILNDITILMNQAFVKKDYEEYEKLKTLYGMGMVAIANMQEKLVIIQANAAAASIKDGRDYTAASAISTDLMLSSKFVPAPDDEGGFKMVFNPKYDANWTPEKETELNQRLNKLESN